MPEITVTQPSTAPAEKVWDIMTAVDRWTEVVGGISEVEKLAGEEFGPGFKWRETREMMGKEATEEMWVTEVDLESHSYVVEAESHGMKYRSVVSVSPAPSGSELKMVFAGDPQTTGAKIMAKTMGKLFEGASRKALQQDLVDIAAAAEASS